MTSRANWAGNIAFGTDRVFYPESLDEVREVVTASSSIRPVGSRHCFNTIADSAVSQISLDKMRGVVSLDEEARTVTVEGGTRYGDLCPWLHDQGYAVHNLASLPHISIVGACATATHGSGVKNGNLATAMSGLEMVVADGSVVTLTRGTDADFEGAVVALGALGVVTKVTLDIEPAFEMKQEVFLDVPVEDVLDRFDEVMSCAYSVSLFTDYGPDSVNQVWIKKRIDEGSRRIDLTYLSGKPAENNIHPIPGADPVNCTQQTGIAGPWYERLPHFRMDFTPSSGKELQAEYFVAREHGAGAYRALQNLAEAIQPVLLTSEVRAIAEDDLWLSMSYGRPSIAFHFTLKQEESTVGALLPAIEAALEPFAARPHWGKLFTTPSDRLESHYDRMADFRDLLKANDPEGKFWNAFLEEVIRSSAP